jgi:hypothetical protein
MLKKQIKKSLLETKEKKEKQFIKESLIEQRISVLFESIKSEKDFKNLSKKEQFKLSLKFIQEMSFVINVGLINEDEDSDWGSVLNKMFGNSFGSISQTIVEPFVRNILSGLGFKEGFVSDFLVSYLTSKPSEVVKSFGDCRMMSKLVAEGIAESMVMSTQRNKGYDSFGYNLIRNQLGKTIKNIEFIENLEYELVEKVCSIMTKLTDNTKSVVEKLKPVINNGM